MPQKLRTSVFACLFAVLTAGPGCSATPEATDVTHATFSSPSGCCYTPDNRPTETLVGLVASGEAGSMQVAALRARGPASLDALLARLDKATPEEKPRLRSAIDKVAAQRDADVSKLYWYTDLEEAKRVAKEQGKPILSLRLLGNLNEELSCANSRFFRTALYPNEKVSRALRERFILHWSSERAAPRITIDFGDGRKVERTITGNSLHYVLDEEGRVLDAIPGLYGPDAFLAALADAESLHDRVAMDDTDRFYDIVQRHHRARAEGLEDRWQQETAQLGFAGVPAPVPVRNPSPAAPPPATIAMGLAQPKMAVEMPVLQATKLGAVPPQPGGSKTVSGPADDNLDQLFEALATRAQPLAKLDAAGRALIERKRPMSWTNAAGPRPLEGQELDRMVAAFEKLMALDTVKNEYRFHARIHSWLATDRLDLTALNARVYEELFLTPASDKWLGLIPPEAYSAIEGDGLISASP
ncbi:MAG: thioredoxin family protein [Polyangiaceae bacterium]|nr:thioredoxin family protein [Polyangiaceae bacterium]